MYKLDKDKIKVIAPLFKDWNNTFARSCLESYMSDAWTDNIDKPTSAQIIIGGFCFFAGIPNIDLVNNIPSSYPLKFILLVPQNKDWEILIKHEYKDNVNKFIRYSIKKEYAVFNKKLLASNVSKLPKPYQIKKIDEKLYKFLKSTDWPQYLCFNFLTYDDFENMGIGYVILNGEEVICGASSCMVYSNGIEIEIDTKNEHRRKGLAYICASKLILECLDKGLYPSWDAANKESVALAEKLGYHFDKEYTTYFLDIKN